MIEISTKDLKIGMFVAHLDRPWLETTFLLQGLLIENTKQIEQLQHLCETVKIDEEQSSAAITFEPFKFKSSAEKPKGGQPYSPREVTNNNKKRFEEEMNAARDVYENTSVSLNKVLNNFRLKEYISIPEVKSSVEAVISSVAHNPNALLLLTNLRSKRQDTVTHSVNVCIFSTMFGRYLALNNEQLSQLGQAAVLHDVGEAKVSDAILGKHNCGLTLEESAQLQMHTQYGAEMLGKIEGMPGEVAEVALSHHERVDGKGYPRQLKGTEISLLSRIVAIVDAYEQVTNNANPEIQLPCSEALKSIYSMRDTFFDGELVEGFIKCLGIYPVGSVVELSNHTVGIVIAVKQDKHLYPTVMVLRDKNGVITHPPQIINLDRFRDHDGKPVLFINKVINPSTVGIDLSEYIVRELGINLN
ncbi:MAG: HD-GYP domain-containing protein [Methylovulum sp.]|nr:HD-GYP domain-containing protein [Methylovulum sp.]